MENYLILKADKVIMNDNNEKHVLSIVNTNTLK